MNKVAIETGRYRAVTPVVVSRFTGRQQLDYREVPAGSEFQIAVGSGYVAREYLTYHPDFGDPKPEVERLS